jgi:hypothetical protein
MSNRAPAFSPRRSHLLVNIGSGFGRHGGGKVDWAVEMATLIHMRYQRADNVILVCDNLNTHTMGVYEAFTAIEARKLVRRLEFRYMPRHGSWLNAAENELSSMTRQCLADRRFGAISELARETAASPSPGNIARRNLQHRPLCNRADALQIIRVGLLSSRWATPVPPFRAGGRVSSR